MIYKKHEINGTNTYTIDTDTAVIIIDPAEGFVLDKEFMGKEKVVLLTHSHYDHIGGVNDINADRVYMHKGELELSKRPAVKELLVRFDITPSHLLNGGEVLEIGDKKVEAIHTPGHSAGSCCYRIENCLFTGDTLFLMEVGRTDLPTGNFETLKKSLKKLFSIKESLKVLSGHGDASMLDNEKLNNPYASP